jgi:uncharacterized protein YceK
MKALNIQGSRRHGLSTRGLLVLLAIAAVSGCSTIRRHPMATAIAVGLVAGSIALSSSHGTQSKQTTGFHPLCAPYCAVQ